MTEERFRKVFLLLLVAGISFVFLTMIRPFLMPLLLAAVFAGLFNPLYRGMLSVLRGHRSIASLLTMLLLVVAVMLPVLGILGVVAGQALRISETVGPWIEERISEPDALARTLEGLPGYHYIEPYRQQILARLAAAVGGIGAFLFESISSLTRGTVFFFFQLFLMLYAMFFFLKDGDRLLARILHYMPLAPEDEQRMVAIFVSVTRATIKGTLLIGLVQGGLAGLALWVVGIDGALFWGTLMVLLSILPGIGTGLVWGPAAVILILSDQIWRGLGLAIFGTLVVSSVDNILRPRLVGHDTKMHDLLVLFSTIGGLLMFGVLGFIVGPIVAALFVAVWEMYGAAFGKALSTDSDPR
jgi:predicted PurR-regulated permease PerM